MENKSILIVDDTPDVREVVKLLLEGEGYQVPKRKMGNKPC